MEGEQTSLSCPIDMLREPLSAIWFHVSGIASDSSTALIGAKQKEPKKVYALAAPVSTQRVLAASVSLVDGSHWKQPRWKHRAFFSLLSDPPALRLNRLERTDTGSYVCNVTYRDDNATTGAVTVTEAHFALFVAEVEEDIAEAQNCSSRVRRDVRGGGGGGWGGRAKDRPGKQMNDQDKEKLAGL
ncbi:hypothetical protein HPB52_024915 [Rhipicephalus sanguineus]|uniref:Ig-like domain-containing protein n=1 Tax=Rhipicephalus sanguineus TaxID=34632 RepID=A0A9D4PAE1_RHISA|nr:hypothetical protein HPB52_024915 [Rhipicephalus sanguineus]